MTEVPYIPIEGTTTMQYLKASKLVGASIGVVALTSIGLPGFAQITVTMAGVSATVPEAGRTEQLNVSQGQRTTLSVGNGVTLGTSAQFTSSIGSVAYPDLFFSQRESFLKAQLVREPF